MVGLHKGGILMLQSNSISNFCGELEGDIIRPVDTQAIVELELSDIINSWLNSKIILPNDSQIRRELCKLRVGKLLKWGQNFMKFIDDPEVTKGTKLIFKNTDGDIKKHPTKNIFYKIIEGCDVQARFE